jgi:hypothetical protein
MAKEESTALTPTKTSTLTPTKTSQSVTPFYNEFPDYNALLNYCKDVVKSATCPFDKPEDVAVVWIGSKELSIPFHTVGLAHFFIVNGKLAIDSHIARILAGRGNIRFQVLEDYRPLYHYVAKSRSFTQDEYDEQPDKFEVYFSADHLKANTANLAEGGAYTKDGKIVVIKTAEPVDYRTKILFKRSVPKQVNKYLMKNGEIDKSVITGTIPAVEEVEAIGTFSWSLAEEAKLTEKDNWRKFPGPTCFARAYMDGGRKLYDDVFHGMYHPLELPDAPDQIYEDTTYEEV